MNFISTKRAKRSYCIALKSKQKEIKTKNGDVIFVSNISLERSKIVFLFEYYFQTFLETIFKKIFKTIFETIYDTIYKTIFETSPKRFAHNLPKIKISMV